METRAKCKRSVEKVSTTSEGLGCLPKKHRRPPLADISERDGINNHKAGSTSNYEKPSNYWATKLQMLEEKEKKLNGDPYEFNSSGGTSNRGKKKKRNYKPRKKKENAPASGKMKSESTLEMMRRLLSKKEKSSNSSKSRVANEGAIIKERVLFNKAQRTNDESFTFDKPPIFGLSSTPGSKGLNLVKPSYFDFESPVQANITFKRELHSKDFGSLSSPLCHGQEINETLESSPRGTLSSEERSVQNVTLRRGNKLTKSPRETYLKGMDAFEYQSSSCITDQPEELARNSSKNSSSSPVLAEDSWDRNVTLRRGKKHRKSLSTCNLVPVNESLSHATSSINEEQVKRDVHGCDTEHLSDALEMSEQADDLDTVDMVPETVTIPNIVVSDVQPLEHAHRPSHSTDKGSCDELPEKEMTSSISLSPEGAASKSGVHEESWDRNVTLRRRNKKSSNSSSSDCAASHDENLMSQTGEQLKDKSAFIMVDPMPAIMQRRAESRNKRTVKSSGARTEQAAKINSSPMLKEVPDKCKDDFDKTEKRESDSDSDTFILATDDESDRGDSLFKRSKVNSTVKSSTSQISVLSTSQTPVLPTSQTPVLVEEGDQDELGSLLNLTRTVSRMSMLPGKRHHRARNVLRLYQTGRLNASCLNATRGKNFESFVESVLKLQPDLEKSMAVSSTFVSNEESRNSTRRITRQSRLRSRPSRFLNITRRSVAFNDITHNSGWRNSLKPALSETYNDGRNRKSEIESTFNTTLRVVPAAAHVATDFRAAYGIGDTTLLASPQQEDSINETLVGVTTARDVVLSRCSQAEPLNFQEFFNDESLPHCKKIGEGVYGEVFMYTNKEAGPTVFKVIPIEGDALVNDEPQKSFAEILSEVVISMELSSLRTGKENCCDGFAELRRVWCVQGSYPEKLLELWEDYNVAKKSENDNPIMFDEDQLYIVLELAHGGQDLESFVFQSAKQAISAFRQATFSLAVAERALEFEHRDFHWGNVLVSKTAQQYVKYTLDGEEYTLPTEGVKVAIIDFTLSRMSYDGCSIFNDLSVDPGLFTSEGDYQFDIYRMMKDENQNNWETFCPRTNVFWLHYVLDKMVKMVKYSHPKSKIHQQSLRTLRDLLGRTLSHPSASSMAVKL